MSGLSLDDFNATMNRLSNVPLSDLNTQLDQFLVSLTRCTPVHRPRTSSLIIRVVRPQLTPRQCRRLKRAMLRELRKRCRVRR